MLDTGFLARTVTVGGEAFSHQIYVPPEWCAERQWPVVLFLHGAGEGGGDGRSQTGVGLGPAIRRHPDRFPAIGVFPQARWGVPWYGLMAAVALAALDRALAELHGDPLRVCLTGVSMGGYGTWRLALDHPHRFAALVPVCGGLGARRERLAGQPLSDPHRAAALRLRHLPAWIFHGAADPIIPVSESRSMAEALRRVDGEVRYTEYPGVGHDCWDLAYAEPDLMPWMLAPHTAEQPVAG